MALDGRPRVEGRVLRDEAHAGEPDGVGAGRSPSTAIGPALGEPGGEVEQRGLARAVRADEADDVATWGAQRTVLKRPATGTETLAEVRRAVGHRARQAGLRQGVPLRALRVGRSPAVHARRPRLSATGGEPFSGFGTGSLRSKSRTRLSGRRLRVPSTPGSDDRSWPPDVRQVLPRPTLIPEGSGGSRGGPHARHGPAPHRGRWPGDWSRARSRHAAVPGRGFGAAPP